MPDNEFAEVNVRRGQSVFIAASAVSVVAVVAVVALVVHPWRDTAGHSLAALASTPATSLDSQLVSPVTSGPAVSPSQPALSSAPASSPAATNSPSAAPSTTPPANRRTSPTSTALAGDSQLNLKVSIVVSPNHVVMGQHARVSVTIVNQGGVMDRQIVMTFGGSDPSDNFSDAQAPCADSTGSISCPISGVRPGQKWSFAFTFVPGPFPGMDGYDDQVSALFDYTNSHGQPQQTPQYFADVQLFNAPVASPAASSAPSTAPPTSAPSTSTASASASPVSQRAS